MLWKPFVVKGLELLMEGCHSSLKVHLEPFPVAQRIYFHSFWDIASLEGPPDYVSECLGVAGGEVDSSAGAAVVVRDVAGAEAEFSDTVLHRSLLELVRRFALQIDRLDDPFYIFSPELRTFLRIVEGYLLGHADDSYAIAFNDFVFHISYSLVSPQAGISSFKTLTDLSEPTSRLGQMVSLPVSTKPHFSITLPEAGFSGK